MSGLLTFHLIKVLEGPTVGKLSSTFRGEGVVSGATNREMPV